MKSFDSRAYSVNDFREWDQTRQLVLSPRFQRRAVWTETAKSYLLDTIIRGKPIPKVFIRQKIDPSSGRSLREVVDGQQRLRAILAYVSDGFVIRKSHNKEFGGLYFSQLPEDARIRILSYEISTDLLINVNDSEVLDIFTRLNAHAVILNKQEQINALHFGPFKQLADDLAHSYFEYWVQNGILRDAQVMRMADVSLTSDLLVAMIDGIRSKKQIESYYKKFEEDFPFDVETLADAFNETMSCVGELYPEGLKGSEFRRIHLFYSLFTAIYHLRYGLPNYDGPFGGSWDSLKVSKVRVVLDTVDAIFEEPDLVTPGTARAQFLNDSRRATTDAAVRERRTEYLAALAGSLA